MGSQEHSSGSHWLPSGLIPYACYIRSPCLSFLLHEEGSVAAPALQAWTKTEWEHSGGACSWLSASCHQKRSPFSEINCHRDGERG